MLRCYDIKFRQQFNREIHTDRRDEILIRVQEYKLYDHIELACSDQLKDEVKQITFKVK